MCLRWPFLMKGDRPLRPVNESAAGLCHCCSKLGLCLEPPADRGVCTPAAQPHSRPPRCAKPHHEQNGRGDGMPSSTFCRRSAPVVMTMVTASSPRHDRPIHFGQWRLDVREVLPVGRSFKPSGISSSAPTASGDYACELPSPRFVARSAWSTNTHTIGWSHPATPQKSLEPASSAPLWPRAAGAGHEAFSGL